MKDFDELKKVYLPELKWYQKILQKLHIKRYYFKSWYKWSKKPFEYNEAIITKKGVK